MKFEYVYWGPGFQYRHRFPLIGREKGYSEQLMLDEIHPWMVENIGVYRYDYIYEVATVCIRDETKALAFRLRWC